MNEPHDVVDDRRDRLNGLIVALKRLAEGLRQVSEAPTKEPQSNEVPVLRLGQGDFERNYFFEDDNS